MTYQAPWSRSVRVITIGVTALLLVVGALIPTPAVKIMLWGMIPFFALFAVRGYELEGGELVIVYPLRRKRVSLRGLRDVHADPEAMKRSIRTFGNGGLFGFTGWFHNSTLGSYRAWVTDPHRAVVLDLPDKPVVVSPDRPNLFVDEVASRTGLSTHAPSDA